MPNSATFSAFVDSATKCLATAVSPVPPASASSSQLRADVALVTVSMVVKVLEATMNSVSAGSRSRTASCRSAPSTFDTKRNVSRAVGVGAQDLVRHRGAEVGAADADVDDVADRLAGVPGPLARAHPVGEAGHLVEHGVHIRHHVLTVDLDHRVARGAQRGVQHGPVLGGVDLLAAEHGVPEPEDVGGGGQFAQQPQGVVGDEVLGVVDVQVADPEGVRGAAAGVGGEQLAQPDFTQLLTVLGQCRPLGRLVEPGTAVCVHLGLQPSSLPACAAAYLAPLPVPT